MIPTPTETGRRAARPSTGPGRLPPGLVAIPLLLLGGAVAAETWSSFERNPIEYTRTLIDASHERVDVTVYKFDEGSIASALRRAIARGVHVRLLVDWDEARRSGSRVPGLVRAGAEVRAWRPGKLHAKFMIVDSSRVVTGSFNWTESAQHKNVEITLDLDDPEHVARLSEIFEALWQRGERVEA